MLVHLEGPAAAVNITFETGAVSDRYTVVPVLPLPSLTLTGYLSKAFLRASSAADFIITA